MAASGKSRALARAVVVLAVMVLVASWPALQAQQQGRPKAMSPDTKKANNKNAGGLRVPVGAPPKKVAKRGDALGQAATADSTAAVLQFQLRTDNADYLNATYYRTSRLDASTAPIVLMVHDKGRSSQDFEEPIKHLDGKSIAEKLRQDGFAVLLIDLRGHGANPRPAKELTTRDWQAMTADLQSAYLFLLDRHNHRELNLTKFAAVGLGTGANLLAHWAAETGAAVAAAPPNTDPRPTDLAALVLVSPLMDAEGMKLEVDLPLFAYRLPLLLEAGENEETTTTAAKAVQKVVERNRQSKVAFVAGSALKSERLLRLDAKACDPLLKFLDTSVKLRRDEWEGRYNLDPVTYRDVRLVNKSKAAAKEKEKDKEAPKDQDKAKDQDK